MNKLTAFLRRFLPKPKPRPAIPYRAYVLAPTRESFYHWQRDQLHRREQGKDWWNPANAEWIHRPDQLRGLAIYHEQLIRLSGGGPAFDPDRYDEWEHGLYMALCHKAGKALGE